MTNRIRIYTICLILFSLFSYSQNRYIDSLNLLLKKAPNDSAKAELLVSLAFEEMSVDARKAEATSWEIINLSKKINYKKGLAAGYNVLANVYQMKGLEEKALENFERAIKIRTEIGDKKGLAGSLHNCGNSYLHLGDNAKALEFYMKGLKMRQEIHDKTGCAMSYVGIGNLHRNLAEYKKSLDYQVQAAAIYKEVKDTRMLNRAYFNIANTYVDLGQNSKAEEFLLKVLKNFEETRDEPGIASAYGSLAVVYTRFDYQKAIRYSLMAYDKRKAIGDKSRLGASCQTLGAMYAHQGIFDSALVYLNEGLVYAESSGEKTLKAKLYSAMADVYGYNNNDAKELEFYEKALKIHEELGDKKEMAGMYLSIGTWYLEDMNDKSLEYYIRAMNIYKETNNTQGLGLTYHNLGKFYTGAKRFPEAIRFYEQSLEIKKARGDQLSMSATYFRIAELHFIQHHPELSKENALKALEIVKRTKTKQTMMTIYQMISRCDSMTGNWKGAFENHQSYVTVRDELYNAETNKQLADAETKYDTEKKERENETLKHKNELAALESGKKDLEINKQKVVILSVCIGLGLMVLLAVFIFRSYQEKKRANEIISKQKQLAEHQKDIIEEKQKEILDSIHYAKRIQNSLITSEKYILSNITRMRKD
jgi:tetratricopeptide (TPR) repeat protein